MKKIVFSLKSLLLAVLVAAVFIVAFLNRSPIWASAIATLTLLLLAIALISLYLFPTKRPFLICALIMGSVYGSAAFVHPLGFHDSLVTTRLMFEMWYSTNLEEANEWFSYTKSEGSNKASLFSTLTYNSYSVEEDGPARIFGDFHAFQLMGHCAVALILAVIAGLVGSYVARRRDVNARQNHVQT